MAIKIIFVSRDNHQSNPAERSIGAISNLLIHYIQRYGNDWPNFHSSAAYVYNTFEILHLGYSPYQMIFNRDPPPLGDYDFTIQHPMSYDYQTYMELLDQRYKQMSTMVLKRHNDEITQRNLDRNRTLTKTKLFKPGDCVFLLFPEKTQLPPTQIMSKKLHLKYVGPLFVYSRVNDTQYILQICEGDIITDVFHIARLKSGTILCPNNRVVSTFKEFQENSLRLKTGQTYGTNHVLNTDTSSVNRAHIPCPGNVFLESLSFLTCQGTKLPFCSHYTEYELHNLSNLFATITKVRYKHGNMQCLVQMPEFPRDEWIDIPNLEARNYVHEMAHANGIRIQGSKLKYFKKIYL
jgi:hypothetical protein